MKEVGLGRKSVGLVVARVRSILVNLVTVVGDPLEPWVVCTWLLDEQRARGLV
jgi:hypothetical protein